MSLAENSASKTCIAPGILDLTHSNPKLFVSAHLTDKASFIFASYPAPDQKRKSFVLESKTKQIENNTKEENRRENLFLPEKFLENISHFYPTQPIFQRLKLWATPYQHIIKFNINFLLLLYLFTLSFCWDFSLLVVSAYRFQVLHKLGFTAPEIRNFMISKSFSLSTSTSIQL